VATAEQHRQVFESLRATGIGVQMHYSPVPLKPYYLAMSFGERQFPEVEGYAGSTNSMWLFQDLYNAAYLPVLMILSEQLQSLNQEVAA
jgi:dTDP-4-amino-4,6-dideoxygalactose transaminase